jgi:hypothetical protein
MGRQQVIFGQSAENWVIASLMQYRSSGLADGHKNWPEIIQKGYQARVVGKAGPDFTFYVRGRAILLEVKTWEAKDRHTYSFPHTQDGLRKRQQYERLCQLVEGGGCLGFYLVCWRHKSFDLDWRLHPVPGGFLEQENGLVFTRQDGWPVKRVGEGWPDWLQTVSKYTKVDR